MRATWSGFLNLSNLTIPIRLYSAVRVIAPRFVRLHAKDHSPVDRLMKCEKDGKVISQDDTVRAVEVAPGKYVEVTESDLHTSGLTTNTMNITQFSEPQNVDPMYYEKPYYIVPSKGGELAYTLLREAFNRAKRIAVVTYRMYEKEHIGLIRPFNGVLMLQQLRYGAEIVHRAEIKTSSLPPPTPEQVEMGVKLMKRYTAPFYIEDYRNEQVDQFDELIARKAKGLPPKRAPRVSTQVTPEKELGPKLKSLLSGVSLPSLPKHTT